ncbi:MAG: hypothetical protein HYW48_10020 [Deltaproteobacteria bacterium]|nr:hypothetical protein [Deltaproteobacteria bacterium]
MSKTTYSKTFKSLGSLLLLTGALSCGVKDPEINPQSVNGGTPSYPPVGDVFRLTESANLIDGNLSEQYRGSLTIWNPDADTKKLAKVLELSKLSREAKDRYLMAKKPVAEVDALIRQKQNSIQKIKATLGDPMKEMEFHFDQEVKLLESSHQWVNARVKPEKQIQLTQYCDTVLLQFASSSFLRNQTLAQRPIPSGLCERSYEERGMFKGATCKDPSPDVGNYFACIWAEGVLKSSLKLYTKAKKEATAEDTENFVKNLNSLKAWLDAKESWVLKAGKLGEDFRIGFNPTNSNPKIADVLNDSRSQLFNAEDAKAVDELNQLRVATDLSTKLTFNDFIYNRHRLNKMPGSTLNNDDKVKLTEFSGTHSEIMGSMFKDPAQAEVQKVEEDIKALQTQKDELFLKANKHFNDAKTIDGNAAKLIKDGTLEVLPPENRLPDQHLGLAIYPDVLVSLDRKGDSVKVAVEVREKRTAKVLTACLDWATSKQVSCEASDKEVAAEEASLNKETGRLFLKTTIEEADDLGFVEKAINEKDADFSLILLEKLAGTRFELELFPARLGETLRTVTGSLTLKDKQGAILYMGSLVLVEPCE